VIIRISRRDDVPGGVCGVVAPIGQDEIIYVVPAHRPTAAARRATAAAARCGWLADAGISRCPVTPDRRTRRTRRARPVAAAVIAIATAAAILSGPAASNASSPARASAPPRIHRRREQYVDMTARDAWRKLAQVG
jgi:hypothetical protein